MKTLTVGIGCRRFASADQIDAAVRAALAGTQGASPFDEIREVATIDSKAREPGLLAFCARHALPLRTFSREQIAALAAVVPTPSDTVREHLGVEGVCEPCALLASSGGQLIVSKTALDGVTVAIATPPGLSRSTTESQPQDTP
jgi:cobalt-precorrin 5A hydrolase